MTHSIDGSVNDLARRRGFAELVEKVKQGSGVDTTGVAANTFFGSHGWPCHAPGLVNNSFLSCWEELKGARTPQNKGSLICAPGQTYLSKGKQKNALVARPAPHPSVPLTPEPSTDPTVVMPSGTPPSVPAATLGSTRQPPTPPTMSPSVRHEGMVTRGQFYAKERLLWTIF